jgi:hypothetical protein
VDNRNEIRDFLTSRRAKITPEQAGLPAYGGRRRVSGYAGKRLPCSPGSASTITVMAVPADPGLSLIVYGAEPGSGSQDALKLLASWTANEEESKAATAIDQLP